MCGSKPKTPEVIERDPIREAADAENVAAGRSNADLAKKRKTRKQSSLLAQGAQGYTGPAANTLLAQAQGMG